ncbi:hypothetical protein [Pseudomonas sp. PH1b]|uniref:hypothetical protein n=1 Tax=Pseudomonas sp. PH1b TaxID=1397282 RepID=UPI0005BBF97C|nr:hypothetical protein [Pseudomonas sp. PH1b]
MDRQHYLFDEQRYPIAWRFNARDCGLSDSDKQRLCFYQQAQSQALWDEWIPVSHLMRLSAGTFQVSETTTLDFKRRADGARFFHKALEGEEWLWLFWGRCSAAQVPRDIFIKCWDDFFYPSDENTALVMPGSAEVIFSFEENFFHGQFVRPLAAPL